MAAVVVDTDVVSFEFKRDSRALLYDPHLAGRELVLSFMTLAELDRWALVHRWGEARRARLDRHLQKFVVCYADRNLCRWWAEVTHRARRQGRPIAPADAWIAATALAMAIPLVTNNSADYAGVDGLTVLTEARH
ncbi:MAG TPA: PIN domain-containing protein [Gemmataceae bacterium]|nr:PIN domain-containing protein [Gemmataceae bacterium]